MYTILDLPTDIHREVFKYIDDIDTCHYRRLNKFLYSLDLDNMVYYKDKFERKFIKTSIMLDYKKVYQDTFLLNIENQLYYAIKNNLSILINIILNKLTHDDANIIYKALELSTNHNISIFLQLLSHSNTRVDNNFLFTILDVVLNSKWSQKFRACEIICNKLRWFVPYEWYYFWTSKRLALCSKDFLFLMLDHAALQTNNAFLNMILEQAININNIEAAEFILNMNNFNMYNNPNIFTYIINQVSGKAGNGNSREFIKDININICKLLLNKGYMPIWEIHITLLIKTRNTELVQLFLPFVDNEKYKNRLLKILNVERCQAFTKKGIKCNNMAKRNGKCLKHQK